jgi:fatty-acid desaturase
MRKQKNDSILPWILLNVWNAMPRIGVIVIIMTLYLAEHPGHAMFLVWMGVLQIVIYSSGTFFWWIFWDREVSE